MTNQIVPLVITAVIHGVFSGEGTIDSKKIANVAGLKFIEMMRAQPWVASVEGVTVDEIAFPPVSKEAH